MFKSDKDEFYCKVTVAKKSFDKFDGLDHFGFNRLKRIKPSMVYEAKYNLLLSPRAPYGMQLNSSLWCNIAEEHHT